MCGRFLLGFDVENVITSFNLDPKCLANITCGDKYPGTKIPVILKSDSFSLAEIKWGFKLPGVKNDIINARIETIVEKPFFKDAFYYNRCIIPANGFYEWKEQGNSKIKYNIALPQNELFYMAGLYKKFLDEDGNTYLGVIVITKCANKDMEEIHERMPVMLNKKDATLWLDNKSSDFFKIYENNLKQINFSLLITPSEGAIQLSF